MDDEANASPADIRRLTFIREETRFELGVMHDRINTLISAEAFLTIAFTMAMGNAGSHAGPVFKMLAPLLSLIGLILAGLAWPGIDTSYKTVLEWNTLLLELMADNHVLARSLWRPPVLNQGDRRADLDQRRSMIFARAVPLVFSVAWAVLTVIALLFPPG